MQNETARNRSPAFRISRLHRHHFCYIQNCFCSVMHLVDCSSLILFCLVHPCIYVGAYFFIVAHFVVSLSSSLAMQAQCFSTIYKCQIGMCLYALYWRVRMCTVLSFCLPQRNKKSTTTTIKPISRQLWYVLQKCSQSISIADYIVKTQSCRPCIGFLIYK